MLLFDIFFLWGVEGGKGENRLVLMDYLLVEGTVWFEGTPVDRLVMDVFLGGRRGMVWCFFVVVFLRCFFCVALVIGYISLNDVVVQGGTVDVEWLRLFVAHLDGNVHSKWMLLIDKSGHSKRGLRHNYLGSTFVNHS